MPKLLQSPWSLVKHPAVWFLEIGCILMEWKVDRVPLSIGENHGHPSLGIPLLMRALTQIRG